jgi:hypothetical protein
MYSSLRSLRPCLKYFAHRALEITEKNLIPLCTLRLSVKFVYKQRKYSVFLNIPCASVRNSLF